MFCMSLGIDMGGGKQCNITQYKCGCALQYLYWNKFKTNCMCPLPNLKIKINKNITQQRKMLWLGRIAHMHIRQIRQLDSINHYQDTATDYFKVEGLALVQTQNTSPKASEASEGRKLVMFEKYYIS